ncbi:MAG TPA: competence/damage-inducible protein A [Prolixibacteraceae bacterium]|nr:competence/damage-inducible protein A [Prolixibacteraceae bacterium]
MNAEIITIGDEILIGQIVDTNSAWMATELNAIGVKIAQITSISDNPEQLVEALDNARKRANIVLMTGGLGPTKDDRTKKVLTSYFHSQLVQNAETLQIVTDIFQKRGLEVTPLNIDQALVPECCTVLPNRAGTAPGMWFEDEGVIFVSMPGVPYEMKHLMTGQVLPRLRALNSAGRIVHRTIQTIGIPESFLAKELESWEDALPEHIHLAYLPSPGLIRLRLSAFGEDEKQLEAEVNSQIEKLNRIIPDAIYGYGEISISEVIGELLKDKKSMVSTAESCTGGMIAHQITLIPGSSEWFKGSVVAYSNEVKQKVLGVEEQMLIRHGAVSEEVVRQMAEGVRKVIGTEYGVATSGVAGPSGGTPEKPVGLVWIAVAGPEKTIAEAFRFSSDRERNITRAALTALDKLRLMLKE